MASTGFPAHRKRTKNPSSAAVTVAKPAMTEVVLLNSLRAAAKDCGWLTYRAQFSMYSVKGWPDLFMVKNGRAYAWELKSAKGKPSEAQVEWIEALKAIPGVDARVVYPDDLDDCYLALVTGSWPRPYKTAP